MEIWKNIEGFLDYQVSSLGRVKSLKFGKERILKHGLNKHGYHHVSLSSKLEKKSFYIHKLVSIVFLNHIPEGMELVINHIDLNKQNNNVENLEIVTQRNNANRKHLNSSSKYTGVNWCKITRKWRAQIKINKKCKYLGSFEKEYDAHLTYEKELKKLIKC